MKKYNRFTGLALSAIIALSLTGGVFAQETTPEVTPEVTLEVTPEVTSEVTPEATAETTDAAPTPEAPPPTEPTAEAPPEGPSFPPLPGEVVISDITPRGISFDSAGNLLIANAGTGGEVSMELPTPGGEIATVTMGLTGEILSVAPDGTVTQVLGGFPSYNMGGSEITGVYRVYQQGESWWLTFTSAGPGAYWGSTVVELDATGMAKTIIPFYPYESANNPDGNELDSNIGDIAWAADGTLLVVDTGANTLYSWTPEGGIQVEHVWPGNDVPTSIEVAENGDIYIGFLGAGIAPGAGKVEQWSDGELVATFGGLTGVTDILLDGDTLYAVEIFLFGEQGPGPGDVVQVSAEGNTVVAGGLIAPFGIAKGPDGSLYVGFGTISFGPGTPTGVVKLPPM